MSIALPGDGFELDDCENSDTKKIGPGLMYRNDKIISTKPGILHKENNKVWLESSQKRYIPSLNDPVVGIVTAKLTDFYRVDIGSHQLAILPNLAFESATKRNRPNLNVGSVVYARVTVANKDLEPEISCMSILNKSDGFGELSDGFIVHCSTGLCKRTLKPDSQILEGVGSNFTFECATGLNGRIWIKANSNKETIQLSMVLKRLDYSPDDNISGIIEEILSK
ncbi:hypothetical protein ROZALSC1DRAFT_26700 [Rozella allomycis CSF55]|uniref:Ribosomal RNA-processing protein 40 n=1 Tax=Rozella allomycis (strain CSF55) TaxID=988480 RepID=A0A075AMR2_ROZAC|nr:Nucleic acid-binding domain-containing protein [Rozella allomycis CSF55]RKP21906.1 hypothetical protein ROZALSC1DRAFT_26700 [Rozella allomycis CSF55]|eukprot:EPZ30979.1 Nucleic acid-binding domain-containing protein [Rozella allomycis CSF55]